MKMNEINFVNESFKFNETFSLLSSSSSSFTNYTTSIIRRNISAKPLTVSSAPWLLVLYSIIFFLATLGNALVILTLVQNKRMRTITNLFLLNLAISDLFLGVFCMPFTLVGAILRNFIFGELMCKLLPYLQASSVSVSSWTLVAISVERYYGICHPLSSRRWQTIRHAYKLIVVIWCGSLLCMLPIAVLSKLIPTRDGHQKCRELWPENEPQYEQAFNIFLVIFLLVLPLIMLTATYSLITNTLWQDLFSNATNVSGSDAVIDTFRESRTTKSTYSIQPQCSLDGSRRWYGGGSITSKSPSRRSTVKMSSSLASRRSNHPTLRRSNVEKALLNKKRVVKMLLLVVLEFFICWTPLYIVNTIALFDPVTIYVDFGYEAISIFQLLAYSSSCCNPITYCFMNTAFRQAFLDLFSCGKHQRRGKSNHVANSLVAADLVEISPRPHAMET